MTRIHVVCEGQTEANFVKTVLSPFFAQKSVVLVPYVVVTSTDRRGGRQHKGGMTSFAKAQNDIMKNMNYTKTGNVFVTTMFDFYRLPVDFPGYDEAQRKTDPYEKVQCIEVALKQAVAPNSPAFIPYIQLHEFEALLFCKPEVFQDFYSYDNSYNTSSIITIADEFKNPELINQGEETAPSKRILNCVEDFDKVHDGVSITEQIGIDTLRQKCCHFNDWIAKLEESAATMITMNRNSL